MYVCVCNAVTVQTVQEAAASGVRCLGELTMRTGCAGTCGCCAELAQELLQQAASLPTAGNDAQVVAA
jgi:bacterioferritin-associated ferredoxin